MSGPRRARLIASANLNIDGEKIGKACVDNGHVCQRALLYRIRKLISEAVEGNLVDFLLCWCEQVCPQGINILDLFEYVNRQYVKDQKFRSSR
ncbi:Acetyl-CoA decarbonylase/synthase complex subunit alpha [uncultured archaeon]|nr:Acetyl-CoA decarbonylase/synthase complex subunit alpha [uncultured archaeon]